MKRLLLALLLAPSLAFGQTARDSAHFRQLQPVRDSLDRFAKTTSAPLYVKRNVARLLAADSALVTPPVVVVVPPAPTPAPTPVPVPVPTQPPPAILPPAPSIGAMVGPATVAELPRGSLTTAYPDTSLQHGVVVAAGTNLQAAINAARGNDVLLLPACSTWIGNFTLPVRSDATTVVIRTNVNAGPEGQRMTPSRAASLCLAKILTPIAAAVISTAPGAHGWRLTALELSTTPAVETVNGGMNRLVTFGAVASNGQTTLASVPSGLLVDRSYLHGTPTLALRGTLALNCRDCGVVDSWLSESHTTGADAQAAWGANGTANVLIQNNYLEASHEVIVFGGSDPVSDSLSPHDISVRGNHVTRPLPWKRTSPKEGVYARGEWQVKNLLETKNVRRLLVEGNVFENNWADAQDGAAIVLKSENQDNTAPFSQTADVTIRDNRITCTGKGFRFSGTGSNFPIPSVTAARITVTNNVVTGVNAAPCTADGTAIHLMSGVRDVIFAHNTILNTGTTSGYGVLFETIALLPTLAMHSNVYGAAGNGALKKGGAAVGTGSLTASVTNALYANNLVLGSGSCAIYPATTLCASALPATMPLGYDGHAIGADTARVNAATANAVVSP